MTENEVIADFKPLIAPHFKIYEEVEGSSIISGVNKRIDMVLESREIPKGLIRPMFFGVEFKADQMESMNDYTSWLRQAIGYTQCVWGRKKMRLPILVAPFIDRDYCGIEGETQSFILSRIAGQFGIGELGKEVHYLGTPIEMTMMKIKFSGTSMWNTESGWNTSLVKMDFKKRYTL
jgi:hypothetical protein